MICIFPDSREKLYIIKVVMYKMKLPSSQKQQLIHRGIYIQTQLQQHNSHYVLMREWAERRQEQSMRTVICRPVGVG